MALRPGDGVPVAVDGFTPGAEVQLFLMGPGPSARLLRPVPGTGSPLADSLGRARWNVRIPEDVEQKLTATDGWWLSADDLAGRYANQPLSLFTGATLLSAPVLGLPLASDPGHQPPGASPSRPFEADSAQPLLVPVQRAAERLPLPPAERWATLQPPELSRGLRSFVTSVPLRVRTEPSTDAPIVRSVPAGGWLRLLDEVAVETEEADFYPVQLADGTRGHVAPVPDDVATIVSIREGQTLGGYRLRAEPSGQGQFQAMVPLGARVNVLETTEDPVPNPDREAWARVRLELRGRILEGYLPAAGLSPVATTR